jgi:hypothetical protein
MALTIVVEQTGIPTRQPLPGTSNPWVEVPRTWWAPLEDGINEASTLTAGCRMLGEQEAAARIPTHSARRLTPPA